MYKKLIGLILALGLLCAMAVSAGAQEADTRLHPHDADTAHCICGGSAQGLGEHTCQDVQWIPISQALEAKGLTMSTGNITVLDSGNYYLDGDVTLTASGKLGSKATLDMTPTTVKELNICLNGYSMTKQTGSIAEVVYMGSALRFCDCSGTQDGEGNWSFDGVVTGGSCNYGSVAYGYAGSLLEVFGGNFYGNAAKNGTIFNTSNDSCGDLNGDGKCDDTDKVLDAAAKGTVNIYNGVLNGNTTTGVGGTLNGFHTSLINIYGGTVRGGSASYGGAIAVSSGTLNIYGGTVTGGSAASVGGNIYAKNVNISGGTISDGSAKYGGNVGGSHIVITGGTIENGTAAGSYGGNVYLRENAAHTVNISGGTIREGDAKYGGNIAVTKCTAMNISGGRIENGSAYQGGNVYCTGSAMHLSGGTITGGSVDGGSGGGVYINANVALTVSGSIQITGNNNSNLYLGGKKTFTAGTFTQGASVGVSPSEWLANLCTNTNLTEDILNYVFSDNPEAKATVSDGKLVLVVDSAPYDAAVSQMEIFDNSFDEALPMTITHKLVMEHMNSVLPEGKTEKKVILIGYDAFRADGLNNIADQTQSAIMTVGEMGGLYRSFCGAPDKSQQTATGAGWSTILSGGWQDLHGVVNNQSTINLGVHTFVIDLAMKGYTGAFIGYGMDNTPNADGTYPGFFTARWAADVDAVKAEGLPVTFQNFQEDADTAAYMAQLLAQTEIPDVMFTYFPEPDQVGHAGGYGNQFASYVRGTKNTDAWGYEVLQAIQARPTYDSEDWLIIVTTDHGGVFNNHGRQSSQERLTWIAVNKPVEMTQENLQYARTTEDLEEQTHTHCVCGGSAQGAQDHTACTNAEFTPISQALEAKGLTMSTAKLGSLDSGMYYLDGNVTVTASSYMGSKSDSLLTTPAMVKDITICLNGYSIKMETGRIFDGIYVDSSLTICDCSASQDANGNWSFRGSVTGGSSANGSILYAYAGSQVNIYGGNFYGNGTTNGGVFAISHDACGDVNGDGKHNDSDRALANTPQAALNLYNGVINGRTVTNQGGAIRAFHGADLNIYGGVINGGTAAYGGSVSVAAGDLTMTGGTITGGNATSWGGAVYLISGTMTMSGGEISNCTSTSYGGGVYVNTNAKLCIQDDAKITGCSGSVGGSVNCAGTVTMTGGIIEKGWPLSGDVEGGNVRIAGSGTFNLQGGAVRDGGVNAEGKTVAKKGGNFQVFGTLNISGGTVSGGKVINQGGNIALWGGTLNLSGGTVSGGNAGKAGGSIMANAASGSLATVNFTGGTVTGGVSGNNQGTFAVENANITVSGDARVENGSLYLYKGRTVSFGAFNEGADILLELQDMTQSFAADASAAVPFITPADSGMYVKDVNGALYLSAAATVNGKYFKTLQEAVDASQGSFVCLYENVAQDVAVNGDVYLDLKGFVLTGNISGEGTLYGMDSTGNEYHLPSGRVEGTVSCNVADHFKMDGKRYLSIDDATGYTFHRIGVDLTHMSLKPTNTGVGYKAVFAADSAVQDLLAETETYGFILCVGEEGQKHTFSKNADSFTSGDPLTLRLQNFDVAGYGETKVYGQVFMKLSDGTVIESSTYSYTLRELVETVASNIGAYDAVKITALQAMITANAEAMKEWDIDSIRNYTAQ